MMDQGNPRSTALDALQRASRELARHLTSESERGELAVIDAALSRLQTVNVVGHAGMREFDRSRLEHLLELTGPKVAPELLARLTEDLENTQESLTRGAAEQDWKRLREGSHVLISLSGSVGAMSLQDQAEVLNAVSHSLDATALREVMPPLAGELAALISVVRATSAARTAG